MTFVIDSNWGPSSESLIVGVHELVHTPTISGSTLALWHLFNQIFCRNDNGTGGVSLYSSPCVEIHYLACTRARWETLTGQGEHGHRKTSFVLEYGIIDHRPPLVRMTSHVFYAPPPL